MRRFYVFRQCRCPPCYLQNYITHPVVCQSYAVGRCGESAGYTENVGHTENVGYTENAGRMESAWHTGERGGKLLKKFFPRSPLSKLKNREIEHADALKKLKIVIRNGVRVHHFKSFKLRSFFEANRRGLGSDKKLFRPLQKQGVNTSVSAEHGYEHVFLKKTLRSIDRSEIFMCRYPSHRREVITLYRDLRG